MRESVVEKHFCKRVAETGGIQRKAQWIGTNGCPDRWCGWAVGTAWVELKKPSTPKAAAHQAREHKRLMACGETVVVLATIEEVDAFIYSMIKS